MCRGVKENLRRGWQSFASLVAGDQLCFFQRCLFGRSRLPIPIHFRKSNFVNWFGFYVMGMLARTLILLLHILSLLNHATSSCDPL